MSIQTFNKIGDYVHYKWSNYVKYGIETADYSKNSSNKLNEATKVFKEQREKLKELSKRENKNKIKQTLETQLNYFFNPTDDKFLKSLGITSDEAAKMQEQIIEIFMKSQDKAIKAIPDFSDLNAFSSSRMVISDPILQSKINRLRSLNEGRTTKVGISNRLRDLIDFRNSIVENRTGSKDILQLLNNFEKKYKNLESLLAEYAGDNKYVKGANTFVKDLNTLITKIKVSSNTDMLGKLGEQIPVITQLVLENKLQKSTDELIDYFKNYLKDNLVVGNQKSFKIVDSSRFISNSNLNETLQANFGGIESTLSYTDDKVDILLKLPNDQPIAASVKNIANTETSINILKGSSILKYIQMYPIFANHYLNIMVSHAIGGPSNSLMIDAHNTMKSTIGVGALQGGLLSASKEGYKKGLFKAGPKAEIFVVNTHGTGKGQFQIYFVDDIINNLVKNANLLNIENFNDNKIWQQEWIGDSNPVYDKAFRRIANVLAKMNAFQLRVSISKQALI